MWVHPLILHANKLHWALVDVMLAGQGQQYSRNWASISSVQEVSAWLPVEIFPFHTVPPRSLAEAGQETPLTVEGGGGPDAPAHAPGLKKFESNQLDLFYFIYLFFNVRAFWSFLAAHCEKNL